MAVIFAVVGVGAAAMVITPSYSEHSDYSNYDNYSNYSDAAERRRRRIEAKQREICDSENEVNQYKISQVNSYLESLSLKQASGVSVDVASVKKDGDWKLDRNEKQTFEYEIRNENQEIQEIDQVIAALNQILEESDN